MSNNRSRLARTTLALAVALVAALWAAPAGATHCKKVKGKFTSAPASPCSSPVGFCTAGNLTGKLRGSYAFTMATLISAGDATVPGVFFYTGTSNITLHDGDVVVATDTGVVDLDTEGTQKMSALLTFISGATGYLQLRGTLDLDTGEVHGKFVGKICR